MLTCTLRFTGFGVEQDTSLPVEEHASNHVALLMTAPPYIFAAFVSFAFAWNSDRIKDRSFHIIPALCLSVVGFVITVSTLNNAARYFAAFLFTPGSFSANPLVYTWAVSTMNTTPEKRAAAGAIVCSCFDINLASVANRLSLDQHERPRRQHHLALLLRRQSSSAVPRGIHHHDGVRYCHPALCPLY